jgi:hypothetical protein
MDSWARIFANTLAMRFTLTGVQAEVAGDLGWAVLRENIESQNQEGAVAIQVEAANIFQRHGGRWYLVHHHGSPVYPQGWSSRPHRGRQESTGVRQPQVHSRRAVGVDRTFEGGGEEARGSRLKLVA